MVWCTQCKADVEAEVDDAHGFSCCISCGRVLEDIHFSSDVQFIKGADGDTEAAGNLVTDAGVARGLGRTAGGARLYGYQVDSQERTLGKARGDIANLVDRLGIRPREETIESAFRFYRLAATRNFTRGRRSQQVMAACIYTVCRQENKPFMLIDFSDQLQVNLFTLGAVFLQLCRMLRLEEHPAFQRPVDPSLFIHRFADKLGFPNKQITQKVAYTALRLVANMKRDWIQTGRRPAAICGAALFTAAHIHGAARSKADVIHVVHVGEQTLEKRLLELTAVDMCSRPFKDLNGTFDDEAMGKETALEAAELAAIEAGEKEEAPDKERCCEHIQLAHADHFARGMCRDCYVDFLKLCGGQEGELNPPAFDAAATGRSGKKKGMRVPQLAAAGDVPLLEDGTAAAARMAEEEEEEDLAREMDNLLAHADDMLDAQARRRGAQAAAARREAAGGPEAAQAAEAAIASASEAARLAERELIEAVARGAEDEEEEDDEERRARGGYGRTPDSRGQHGAAAAAAAAVAASPGAPQAPANPEGAIVPFAGGAGGAVAAAAEPDEVAGPDPLLKEDVSDLDDDQVKELLHTDEEAELKYRVWVEMNREFLENQALKAKLAEAQAAAGTENTKRARKGRKKTPNPGAGGGAEAGGEAAEGVPESAEAAARRMLDTKRFSSKINYSALADLFGGAPGGGGGGEGGEARGEDGDEAGPSTGPGKGKKRAADGFEGEDEGGTEGEGGHTEDEAGPSGTGGGGFVRGGGVRSRNLGGLGLGRGLGVGAGARGPLGGLGGDNSGKRLGGALGGSGPGGAGGRGAGRGIGAGLGLGIGLGVGNLTAGVRGSQFKPGATPAGAGAQGGPKKVRFAEGA